MSLPERNGLRPRLSDVIRAKKGEILAAWERSVRRMQAAEHLSPPALIDHMPPFLLDLAARLDERADAPSDEFPRLHALSRLELGYDLKTVVAEYAVLRACLVDVAGRQVGPEARETELPRLHAFLDEAISESVDRYVYERERAARTEAHASEGALRHSEELTAAILDSLHEGIVFQDERGLVQRTNRSAERFFGVGQAALRGRSSADFEVVGEDGAPLPPEQHPAMLALRTGTPQLGVRVGLRANDGRRAWVTVNSQPVRRAGGGAPVGVVSSFFDTTAQRRSEEQRGELAAEVERQRSRLETVLALLPVGVVLRDVRTLEVILINEAARRIYGKYIELVASPEDYAREPLLDAEGAPVPHGELPLMRTRRGELVEHQLLRVPLEPPRVVEVAAAPIRGASGEVVATVLTLVDVTESKQLEAELRSALGFRDRILGVLSHDLRNPLAVIKMSAGALMRASDLNERHLRGLSRIDANADRVLRMIHDLLDFTRARLGAGIPVVPRAANLHHLCQQVIESMQVLYPSRSFHFTASGNTRGEWDPDRVLQAIQNLVANAVLYSPESSPVTLTLSDQGEIVELAVHNEGEPIPPALLPELFEPFRSSGSAHADGERGVGLGLYIVRELVEAHGGSIAVRSGSSGTSFIVRFPRR